MAYPYTKSSGLITSDQVIIARTGILLSVTLLSNRTQDVELSIYDNATTASGNILFKSLMPGNDDTRHYDLSGLLLKCNNGLYVDLTGTGAACVIYYK